MIKVTLKIDGMKCGMCESHINDIIRKTMKVLYVKSKHKTGLVMFIIGDDYKEIIDLVIENIKKEGYNVFESNIDLDYKKKGLFW